MSAGGRVRGGLLGLIFACCLAAGPTVAPLPALAVKPHEMLDDPALEARARELSRNIRCLVCQNESIDDSNADLAADMRVLLRERLTAGDSDEEVLDYLVARYGEFVLLRPRLQPSTYLLYGGPPLLLVIGGLAVVLYVRRQRRRAGSAGDASLRDELTDEERARLDAVLGERANESTPSRS